MPASLDGEALLPLLVAAPLLVLPAVPEAGWFCMLESAGAAGVVGGSCEVVAGMSVAGAPVTGGVVVADGGVLELSLVCA